MSTIREEPDHLWQAVLGQLQMKVSRPIYETWLKDTSGVSYDDGVFVVNAPDTFVAEMLEHRLYELISQTLNGVVPTGADIRFHVAGSPANAEQESLVLEQTPPSVATAVAERPDDESSVDDGPASFRTNNHNGRPAVGAASFNPRYTFESFIVGTSNELAHAAALAVSDRPAITYNPLFLYSGVGLGKTHLLHAIGHRFVAAGLSTIYATCEEFTNQYIKAIREGNTEEFRERYRSAEALLLDDIQFIIGKEQTQEGFFHTFNSLHMAAKQIIITSDRPVTSLTLLEDRVRSRLAGGLTVDIQHPDLETRQAILRVKADETGAKFPSEVLEFLAERVHKNVRELEGSLNRVAAYAQLTGTDISVDMVKNALADTLNPTKTNRVSEQLVVNTVSAYFSIDEESLKGRRRDKQTALARQVAMYLLREELNLSLAAVGRTMGGKDHTTVLHACTSIAAKINVDAHLRRDVINIREALTKG